MKILGLIPARGGSKGVPRKNIKLLHGKPLIQYTIDPALQTGLFNELIVSTDDEEIAAIAKELGAVSQLRPPHLATDKSPTIDTVAYVLQTYSEMGKDFDAVCLLQPTNPLRSAQLIQSCIEKFEKELPDSLISMRRVPHEFNPHWMFEVGEDGFVKIATGEKHIIPRRQELPEAYFRDGSIYLTHADVILKEKSLYGTRVSFLDVTEEPYLNIDTLSDWEAAEKAMSVEKP